MSQFKRHVFICTYGPYCWFDGDTDEILKRLKRRVAQAGLKDEIRINRSGCLNHCGHGPVAVIYPDAVWYGHVQPEDADELFDEHICHGRPVDRLTLDLPPGNNKQTEQYPDSVHGVKQLEKELDERRAAARSRIRAEAADDASPSA